MNDFGRLLEKEIPRLRRYAFALTRNMSGADDLVQDTLVRAIAKQHFWQRGTNLRAWLFTLMHNQNADGIHRSVREGIIVGVDEPWPGPTAATDPTELLSLRDLDRALARIHEEQRRVLLLIGLEGASYEEAARILDVPVGTVRSRVSRGREALRKLMDRRDGTEPANGAAFASAVPKRRRFVLELEMTQNSAGAGLVAGTESLTMGAAPRPV
jgi:RNA polymerase sigma-70 factor (ECF subfamily)